MILWTVSLTLAVVVGIGLYVFRVTSVEVTVIRLENARTGKERWTEEVHSDRGAVKAFTYAVRFSVRQKGAVNTVDPPYKFILDDKTYSMWLDEKSTTGSIANVDHSETLYKLRSSSASRLKERFGIS